MRPKKNTILLAIQAETPLSYEQVKQVYEITNSYDAIVKLNTISLEFHVDIIELAMFLYRS